MVGGTCKFCGKDRVNSIETTKEIFRMGRWPGELPDGAVAVCSYCKMAYVPDEGWERMCRPWVRAKELAESSSNPDKDVDYYMEEIGAARDSGRASA